MAESKEWVVKLYYPAHTTEMPNGPPIISEAEEGYYSEKNHWKAVPKSKATWLTHKEALKVASYLKQPRIGYKTEIERLEQCTNQ